MKKVVYTCDMTGETAESDAEFKEKFMPEGEEGFFSVTEGGTITINEKNFQVSLNVKSEEVQHLTRDSYQGIVKLILETLSENLGK